MLVMKMMSGEELPDSDENKSYDLFHFPEKWLVRFKKHDETGKPCAFLYDENGELKRTFPLEGSCYVMDGGKTISKYRITPRSSVQG